jgi:uncharacterized protein YkwD
MTKKTDVEKSSPTSPSKTQNEILLDIHNDQRQNRSLKPLASDKQMDEYAQKHAETMAKKNRLYHSSMSDLAKAAKNGNVAENIAWGQDSEEEVVKDWMNSPGHRYNILGKSYKRAGFGMAKSKDGTPYWCAVFAN